MGENRAFPQDPMDMNGRSSFPYQNGYLGTYVHVQADPFDCWCLKFAGQDVRSPLSLISEVGPLGRSISWLLTSTHPWALAGLAVCFFFSLISSDWSISILPSFTWEAGWPRALKDTPHLQLIQRPECQNLLNHILLPLQCSCLSLVSSMFSIWEYLSQISSRFHTMSESWLPSGNLT